MIHSVWSRTWLLLQAPATPYLIITSHIYPDPWLTAIIWILGRGSASDTGRYPEAWWPAARRRCRTRPVLDYTITSPSRRPPRSWSLQDQPLDTDERIQRHTAIINRNQTVSIKWCIFLIMKYSENPSNTLCINCEIKSQLINIIYNKFLFYFNLSRKIK